ncbi:MAG: nitrate ABC transporter substrate-binding protein [Betaproteobacteria bacterium RIFCSPLOWO2_12_FULL_62_13]|nr:MAG: nitrate ABC transporter substrate-binding protein [Betaproteobacteria bacterium RIFCSPLOWO2_12_FULL_62_13]
MTLRVAIPDLISPSYFPAIAAVELGFFKQEGLDATIELLFPVTRTYEELRDGRLDFVAGAAHAPLYAFKNWNGCKLLAALGQHMYWFLVLRKDLGAKRGDLGALRGLRIGAAPGPADGLKCMLIEAGIDPEREVRIGPVPGAAGAGVSFGVAAAKALEEGKLDGFWANGMGAEVAVRNGIGTLVLDARRGDWPPAARDYTFPAFVTTQKKIDDEPDLVAAAVRALVGAQQALKQNPARATEVGEKLFPETEAGLIAELIQRDTPFYDPSISRQTVDALNNFARKLGILSETVSYDQVVATKFRHLWKEKPAGVA